MNLARGARSSGAIVGLAEAPESLAPAGKLLCGACMQVIRYAASIVATAAAHECKTVCRKPMANTPKPQTYTRVENARHDPRPYSVCLFAAIRLGS